MGVGKGTGLSWSRRASVSWCHLCEDLTEGGEEAVRTSGEIVPFRKNSPEAGEYVMCRADAELRDILLWESRSCGALQAT